MLKQACYVVFLCVLSSSLQAQSLPIEHQLSKSIEEDLTAELVMIRKTGLPGTANSIKAFTKDEALCRLNNNHFAKHTLSGGSHTISYQYFGKKAKKKAKTFDVNLKANETKYVLFFLESGFIKNKVHVVELAEESAAQYLAELKLDEK